MEKTSKCSFSATEIFDRIKSVLKISKDVDLASFFDEEPKKLATWKVRNTIPFELIMQKSSEGFFDLDYIFDLKTTKRSDHNQEPKEVGHLDVLKDRSEKLEEILIKSQGTLDRYLSLVEQQQNIIEHLSKTLSQVTEHPTSSEHKHQTSTAAPKIDSNIGTQREFRERPKIPDNARH